MGVVLAGGFVVVVFGTELVGVEVVAGGVVEGSWLPLHAGNNVATKMTKVNKDTKRTACCLRNFLVTLAYLLVKIYI